MGGILEEFLLPGCKQIPFCAYNSVGYREQARAQLEAMEPARARARRTGVPYQPSPVAFDFANHSEPLANAPLLQIGTPETES